MKSLGIKWWFFQFDNDPKHKSTKEKDYLELKNIKTIYLSVLYIQPIENFGVNNSKLGRNDIKQKSWWMKLKLCRTNLIILLSTIELN